MSVDTLTRIKNLIVASCDSLKQGNRDIASNIMELALDEMGSLEPEDLDIGISVIPTVEAPVENAFENEIFDGEYAFNAGDSLEEIEDTAAYTNLRDIVSNMVSVK